jgi:hypothetical protein
LAIKTLSVTNYTAITNRQYQRNRALAGGYLIFSFKAFHLDPCRTWDQYYMQNSDWTFLKENNIKVVMRRIWRTREE